LKNNYLEIACLVKCPVLIQLLFGFILQVNWEIWSYWFEKFKWNWKYWRCL